MIEEKRKRAALELVETVPPVIQLLMLEMRHYEPPISLTSFRILLLLGHAPKPVTMTYLAQSLQVAVPTMSATVNVLVDHGWVERMGTERDRRRTEVHLTPKGSETVRSVHHRICGAVLERLEGLSSEQLDQLSAGVNTMQAAFGSWRCFDEEDAECA